MNLFFVVIWMHFTNINDTKRVRIWLKIQQQLFLKFVFTKFICNGRVTPKHTGSWGLALCRIPCFSRCSAMLTQCFFELTFLLIGFLWIFFNPDIFMKNILLFYILRSIILLKRYFSQKKLIEFYEYESLSKFNI